MKQLQFFADARKLPLRSLAAALDKTEVPVEIYHNLIAAVRESFPVHAPLYAPAQEAAGRGRAPLLRHLRPHGAGRRTRRSPLKRPRRWPWKLWLPWGRTTCAMLKEGFDNRWIDVYENQGKRSGAYSSGAVQLPSLCAAKLHRHLERRVHPGPRDGPRPPLLPLRPRTSPSPTLTT